MKRSDRFSDQQGHYYTAQFQQPAATIADAGAAVAAVLVAAAAGGADTAADRSAATACFCSFLKPIHDQIPKERENPKLIPKEESNFSSDSPEQKERRKEILLFRGTYTEQIFLHNINSSS